MFRICKSFTFDAAHRLIEPYEGKCSRMHGHRYRLEVMLAAESLNPCGMVQDFSDLSPLAVYLSQRFDHQKLNDTVEQPTAENIARHIFDWCASQWPNLRSVRVWETDTAWAEYSR